MTTNAFTNPKQTTTTTTIKHPKQTNQTRWSNTSTKSSFINEIFREWPSWQRIKEKKGITITTQPQKITVFNKDSVDQLRLVFVDCQFIPEVFIGSRSSLDYGYLYYVDGDRTYFFDDRQPIGSMKTTRFTKIQKFPDPTYFQKTGNTKITVVPTETALKQIQQSNNKLSANQAPLY